MSISVVVTTYNQPEWLALSLTGLAAQGDRDFSVLVADDGSGSETRACIERVRARTGLPIEHVWHEDRGFRKCEILNRAIRASGDDYLIFIDGDCIARRDFVGVHRALRRPRRFLSGGYVKLDEAVSAAITADDVDAGRPTEYRWLRARGARASRRLRRLGLPRGVGAVLDFLTPTRASFNGHNASAWRADLEAVNGFNEDMGYGGLDRELGERLENAGVRGTQVRHRAAVVHLDHPRGYRDQDVLRRNRAIRDEVAATGRIWTAAGLDRQSQGEPV
ncbi:MAG: glycosyltransferase family 2 protein [Gemmatimonadota bacterium]